MSEYQYIYFAAVDRPLDDKQLEFMERQSTRADISRWEFRNEYHFGDFHGDAEEMLRRGYDVHLHYANFGVRKLMLRLPEPPCDKKMLAAFEIEYAVTWTKDKRGTAGMVTFEPEADADTYDDAFFDFDALIRSLAAIREMLQRGDLRPLYLAWLAAAWDEEATEPPVPAGMGQLDGALQAMAEFYELSPDLITAVAQRSPPAAKKPDRRRKHAIRRGRWASFVNSSNRYARNRRSEKRPPRTGLGRDMDRPIKNATSTQQKTPENKGLSRMAV